MKYQKPELMAVGGALDEVCGLKAMLFLADAGDIANLLCTLAAYDVDE